MILRNLLSRELMEDHDVVDAIQKLRFEVQPQFLQAPLREPAPRRLRAA